MPADNRKLNNSAKPLTPRAPIQPKNGSYLAPKLSTGPRVTPSPELRRDDRNGKVEDISRVPNGSNIATPVKTFLASNVTPRSSSRRSRADSPVLTPNSTPGGQSVIRGPGSVIATSQEPAGLGIQDSGDKKSGDIAINMGNKTGPVMARRDQPAGHGAEASPDIDSKFFHASEADTAAKISRPPITRTGTGFFYANGNREEPTGRPASIIGTKVRSQVGAQNKFHYANGKPETSPVLSASPAGMSPILSPRLPATFTSPRQDMPRERSTSPLKDFEVPGQQRTRKTSGASNSSIRSSAKSTFTPQTTRAAANPAQTFQKSPETSSLNPRGHTKTQSLSSINSGCQQIQSPVQPDPSLFAIGSPASVRNGISSPSLTRLHTTQLGSLTTPSSPLVSPDKAGGSDGQVDQLVAMASNARRERKVLDLEISNSSLLAINRTLEREMRKQKAELRRYRRLTSHGRLSIAPTERSVSGTTTISTLSLDSDRDGYYESEEEDTITDVPSESDSELDHSDNSISLSPAAQAAHDLRQQARDEKRLQLDLNKHQQLLNDSQKMNESLKRCLGMSENLIIEGKKALEYQIRPSEVTMGGRVLHEDDNPDMQDVQPRLGLLSPTTEFADNVGGLPWTPEQDGDEQIVTN